MAKSVVGQWAKDKLDRLSRYLHEYTKIMRKQRWCEGYYYIDAFAGPGQHEVRNKARPVSRNKLLDVARFGQSQEEQQEFLAGSPRVALDIEYPFSAYVFVERSPVRVKELETLKAEYGNSRRIVIRQKRLQRLFAREGRRQSADRLGKEPSRGLSRSIRNASSLGYA